MGGMFHKAVYNFLDLPELKVKDVTGVKLKSNNTSLIKSTAKVTSDVVKNMYLGTVDWTNAFYNTEIYNLCCKAITDQIFDLCGEYSIGEVPMFIELEFSQDYWFRDIQNKYTKPQLKRIEKEFKSGKNCQQLCYEMLYFAWSKLMPCRNLEKILDESDIFKVKNKVKR